MNRRKLMVIIISCIMSCGLMNKITYAEEINKSNIENKGINENINNKIQLEKIKDAYIKLKEMANQRYKNYNTDAPFLELGSMVETGLDKYSYTDIEDVIKWLQSYYKGSNVSDNDIGTGINEFIKAINKSYNEFKNNDIEPNSESDIDKILKSNEYKELLKSISLAERLSELKDANLVYTKNSLGRLRIELEKSKNVINDKQKLTNELVKITRDSLELAIVELVKIKDINPGVQNKPESNSGSKPNTKPEIIKPEVKPGAPNKPESNSESNLNTKIGILPQTGDVNNLPYIGSVLLGSGILLKLNKKKK